MSLSKFLQGLEKRRMGSFRGGHRCGVGHGDSDDKVSEYGLGDVKNLVVGVYVE